MKIVRDIYLTPFFFYLLGGLITLFVLSFFFPVLFPFVKALTIILAALIPADLFLLFKYGRRFYGQRVVPERLSLGDDNEIGIVIHNHYPFKIRYKILDELPFQFQKRDFEIAGSLDPGGKARLVYHLKPLKRGEYVFGNLNFLVGSPMGLIIRRWQFNAGAMVPVYPAFLQMRKYELLAFSSRTLDAGIKKLRRVGHTMEFDQIRMYNSGDDIRSLNWKASSRMGHLMVNQFRDERSQQVYSLIDKGRLMKMPFEGMTLLDYSVNAALHISGIALKKQDKAGVITFADKVNALLPASNRASQLFRIMEMLYNEETVFPESGYEDIFSQVRRSVRQRSLLLFFTNFESMSGMQRQLGYFRSLARQHLVVVIFFENTELQSLVESKAGDTEEVYIQAIAGKLLYEKRLIVKELNRHGIHSVLTEPAALTINVINKYLEFKARGLI